jgi:hypothetical protein
MSTSATIMLLIGAVFLWGGVAVASLHYVRASRKDTRTYEHE